MSKVLVLTEYYLPGFNGGGVLRTLANLVAALEKEFSFFILCRSHDLGNKSPYPKIYVDKWNQRGQTSIFYVASKKNLYSILRNNSDGIWYLNSVFSFFFSILPLVLQKFIFRYPIKIILAPKGELFPAAKNIKSFKKNIFIKFAKMLNLYKNVLWHASTEEEAIVIQQVIGKNASIKVALDLPATHPIQHLPLVNTSKIPEKLNIVSISRIAPIKNILTALEIISDLPGQITFNIYGPIENQAYWQMCQSQIQQMPSHIKVIYHGVVPNNQVCSIIADHDVFFLPSLSESFGHVIFEALLAGCPVLISDQTPWKNLLEKNIGADLPLASPEQFKAYLMYLISMDANNLRIIRKNARAYALKCMSDQTIVNQNRDLFR